MQSLEIGIDSRREELDKVAFAVPLYWLENKSLKCKFSGTFNGDIKDN